MYCVLFFALLCLLAPLIQVTIASRYSWNSANGIAQGSKVGFEVGGRLEVIVYNLTTNLPNEEPENGKCAKWSSNRYAFLLERTPNVDGYFDRPKANEILADEEKVRLSSAACASNNSRVLETEYMLLNIDTQDSQSIRTTCFARENFPYVSVIADDFNPTGDANLGLKADSESEILNNRWRNCAGTPASLHMTTTIDESGRESYSLNFRMTIARPEEEDIYQLSFINCNRFTSKDDREQVRRSWSSSKTVSSYEIDVQIVKTPFGYDSSLHPDEFYYLSTLSIICVGICWIIMLIFKRNRSDLNYHLVTALLIISIAIQHTKWMKFKHEDETLESVMVLRILILMMSCAMQLLQAIIWTELILKPPAKISIWSLSVKYLMLASVFSCILYCIQWKLSELEQYDHALEWALYVCKLIVVSSQTKSSFGPISMPADESLLVVLGFLESLFIVASFEKSLPRVFERLDSNRHQVIDWLLARKSRYYPNMRSKILAR